ncbi:MerR family transcriptional regulator [Streptomyces dangxiongensis]|uniref:MerR family transcriptional regulator n=2 Tax=Streptomyces dangxiongensis TaxID=1442032 RepID=A0A3G2JKM4_9ACTN|nr:MerR family transcriptional regulator [Streptomyces dangxiongensis]AYN42894.1 MerR family transcriptional regulator [Streptomyces dangxiongensis]
MPGSGRVPESGRAGSAGAAEPGLTTGALARRLGVSPTTLRSWDRRYGMGPAARVDGRHRRWTPRDVTMLETMCRLTASGVPPADAARAAKERAYPAAPRPPADGAPTPAAAPPAAAPPALAAPADPAAPAAGAPSPTVGAPSPTVGAPSPGAARQEGRGLARAAVRLDAAAVGERLEAAVDRYGVVAAWQDVMLPTLHAVGRRWESSGDRYVEVEHLLSWQVSTTLRGHTRRPVATAGPTGAGPVLLACVPGEQHTLPLEALNAALSQLGIATRMFGAAVPADALVAAVRRLGPAAVVLWAQARSTASLPLAEHVAAMEWGVKGARAQPLVMLGGPGWAGRPAPGMLRPAALTEALAALVIAYGAAEPVRPAAGAPPTSPH